MVRGGQILICSLMGGFGKLRLSLDMFGVEGTQEMWRFFDLKKAHDLFRESAIYLRQVALLRDVDERESRLPAVIRERLTQANQKNLQVRQFIDNFLTIAENQADRVYASCWYLPDETENYEHMWEEFGGGKEGGVCVVTTVERLGNALVDEGLSIGLIRYIEPDISFEECWYLEQYRSSPFLLKLANHSREREARLFRRHHWIKQPKFRYEKVHLVDLIQHMKLSPLVSDARNREISDWFVSHGFPEEMFELPR
jgi:hypothetical protein